MVDEAYRAEIDRRIEALEVTVIQMAASYSELEGVLLELTRRLAAEPSTRMDYIGLVKRFETPAQATVRMEIDAKARADIRRRIKEARE